MSSTTRARRVATWLVAVAGGLAVAWVIALIVTGQDNGALRIFAVLPGAVGITLFRLFPKSQDDRATSTPEVGIPAERGATVPAPVDIVDRHPGIAES